MQDNTLNDGVALVRRWQNPSVCIASLKSPKMRSRGKKSSNGLMRVSNPLYDGKPAGLYGAVSYVPLYFLSHKSVNQRRDYYQIETLMYRDWDARDSGREVDRFFKKI
jgi:hypothetical protein